MTNSQIEKITFSMALEVLTSNKVKIKIHDEPKDIRAKAREILRNKKKVK